MTPTTYGYRIMDVGDKAKGTNGWFESINFNFERLDEHNHDGVNSTLLSVGTFAPFTNSIAAVDWAASGSGYRTLVTVPAGIDDINNYNVKFIFTAPVAMVGEIAYLGYDRVSANTFYVYCNDNTAALTLIYR